MSVHGPCSEDSIKHRPTKCGALLCCKFGAPCNKTSRQLQQKPAKATVTHNKIGVTNLTAGFANSDLRYLSSVEP